MEIEINDAPPLCIHSCFDEMPNPRGREKFRRFYSSTILFFYLFIYQVSCQLFSRLGDVYLYEARKKIIRDFNLIRDERGSISRQREREREKEGRMIKSSVSRYHLPQKLGTARFNGFLTVYNATRNLFVMYLVLRIILTAFCCSKRTGLKEIVFLADITRRTIKLPSSSHHVTPDSPLSFPNHRLPANPRVT